MTWLSYKEKISEFSRRLVVAQGPIRILNAIKFDQQIKKQFVESNYKSVPKVPKDYFTNDSLGFSLEDKKAEFKTILSDIKRELGAEDDAGKLLAKIANQYLLILEMLKTRGTKDFHRFSSELYGSPKDLFLSDHNTIFEMSKLLYSILTGIKSTLKIPGSEKIYTSSQVVDDLNSRFSNYFSDIQVEAILSDGIVADAAAGGDKVKIRTDAMFSLRDIDIYEVHEGWVHVGTTMNGRNQPVAKWLSIGPPRCTSTQEGLAVLMEIFTFRTSVKRAQRINDRIIAIAKSEEGASIVDIFEYFRTEGYTEDECLDNSFRVFRGGILDGGAPFTKDISYCKGFVENYNFMRAAIRANKPELIPFLFIGKVHVEDIPFLYKLSKEGIVEGPKYLPPQFKDINGIAVWMSFSSFFNKVDLKKVQTHYNKLFKLYT